MELAERLIALGIALPPILLLTAVFVRSRRMDGSGLSGGLPFYPSSASGGFAETPKPAWATDPAWLAEVAGEDGKDRVNRGR